MVRFAVLTNVALAGLVALGCSGSSGVPTGPGPPQAAAELDATAAGLAASEIAAASVVLDLDDTQAAALEEAFRNAWNGLAEVRGRWLAGEIGAEQAVAEARAIRNVLDAALESILTTEQLAALRARTGAATGPPLSDEQRATLHEIADRFRVLALKIAEQVRAGEIRLVEAAQLLREGAHLARVETCAVLLPEQRPLLLWCEASGG
jgi:hypothetical protein